MKNFRKKRIALLLLSALLLAPTASVRAARAEVDPAATPPPEDVLTAACAKPGSSETDTAAYAAELLRLKSGLVSCTSLAADESNDERVADCAEASARAMANALSLDLSEWTDTLVAFEPTVYDSYAQNAFAFSSLAELIKTALKDAFSGVVSLYNRDLREISVPLYTVGQPVAALNWKETAALYYVFGDSMTGMIASAYTPDGEGDAENGVTIYWNQPTFEEIAAFAAPEDTVEALMAYYYLNTVYEDDGSVAAVVASTCPAEYLATIAHPVPGGVIKNGWYDPRSHKTRLHVGTDITMDARTPIHSATDGIVKYIGYLPIPGNYVIIEDPYGYEYHYYHMNEISTYVTVGQSVQQGDVIGRVGDTGNSVAYHLHLGIVSPDDKYLNPYDILVAANLGPVLGAEEP